MTLTQALAERVRALERTNERLRALADPTEEHVVQPADADVVLKQALRVLSVPAALESARGLLRGRDAAAASDELAKAGLAAWDPESNAMRPTPLLVELMKVVDP